MDRMDCCAQNATVLGALRRFLPQFLRTATALDRARRRALWAIMHCRTEAMGGHLHACKTCRTSHWFFHSCNHRSCPQCGRADTAQWVERELSKRVGAPHFMVTFTLPAPLRTLFFTRSARAVYDAFFGAAAGALASCLADPRWLGAATSGFTMVLHTWNQRLHFHPHIHCMVPGAGVAADASVVAVKSPHFLVPQPALRAAFRREFRQRLEALLALSEHAHLPPVDPAVWTLDWGVHLQAFGDGANIIRYLGTYVCRTAIADARILRIDADSVTFSWKDRAHGDARRLETVSGVEFVRRYLLHVLPRGLRAIRRFGFCHPAAKRTRERIAFHTGVPLLLGPEPPPPPQPAARCPQCGHHLVLVTTFLPFWKTGRAPPQQTAPPSNPPKPCRR